MDSRLHGGDAALTSRCTRTSRPRRRSAIRRASRARIAQAMADAGICGPRRAPTRSRARRPIASRRGGRAGGDQGPATTLRSLLVKRDPRTGAEDAKALRASRRDLYDIVDTRTRLPLRECIERIVRSALGALVARWHLESPEARPTRPDRPHARAPRRADHFSGFAMAEYVSRLGRPDRDACAPFARRPSGEAVGRRGRYSAIEVCWT